MKTFALVLMFAGAVLVRGGGYVPEQDKPPEEFTLEKQDLGEGKESIFVKLKDGTRLLIGQRTVSANVWGNAGVMPESIHVYRLKGTPDLLYLEWSNYIQGNGGYQSAFYQFCRADSPEKTLIRGAVGISGHWGWATGMSGSLRVRYRDNVLRIRVTTGYRDTSSKPKPLFRLIPAERRSRWAAFASDVTKTVTRVFGVADDRVELKSALLEYKVQDGDTIDAICDGLRVKREWVQSPQLLEMQASTISIVIPNDVALKRYPTIEKERE